MGVGSALVGPWRKPAMLLAPVVRAAATALLRILMPCLGMLLLSSCSRYGRYHVE